MPQSSIPRAQVMDEIYDREGGIAMDQYYRHFRNRKIYRFVTFATIEATREEAVVYQALYGAGTNRNTHSIHTTYARRN